MKEGYFEGRSLRSDDSEMKTQEKEMMMKEKKKKIVFD